MILLKFVSSLKQTNFNYLESMLKSNQLVKCTFEKTIIPN